MIAKFPGICTFCSTRTEPGDEYDPATRKSWHVECAENQPPSASQYALAEKLGYRQYSWEELYAKMPGGLERQANVESLQSESPEPTSPTPARRD